MEFVNKAKKQSKPDDSLDISSPRSDKTSKKSSRLTMFVLVLLLVGAVGVAGLMTKKYQDLKKNPNSISQKQQETLLNKVGALIDLPKDEQPSIATVSDKEKLKEQAFFKTAENGDTLLIYTNAKKAILYRESSNKIVEVAPIAIDTTQAGTTAGQSTEAAPNPESESSDSEQ